MAANDTQVGGEHYKAELQHWDYVTHVLRNRYLEGQVTKYVTRWRKKNGVQDLQKALHYLLKLREMCADGSVLPQDWPANASLKLIDYRAPFKAAFIHAGQFPLEEYCTANELTEVEREITLRIVIWLDDRDLAAIATLIEGLLCEATKNYVDQG